MYSKSLFRLSSITKCNFKLISKTKEFGNNRSFHSQCNQILLDKVPFKLADIGEGIAEVELMKWFIKEGDVVKSFDRLCEVQSDKATVEITSRYDGKILKVHHEEGGIVKVGEVLVDIDVQGSGGAKLSSDPKPAVEKTDMTQSSNSASRDDQILNADSTKVLTTPAVRKIAKELGINLSTVPGTGPKGRVLKEDILSFGYGGSNSLNSNLSKIENGDQTPTTRLASSFNINKVEDQIVPIRGIQRLMVKTMTAANAVKHLTLGEEVQFNNLIQLRKKLKTIAEKLGVKLSYMPVLIKATSMSLSHHPIINSTVNAEATELTIHGSHNIGIAMDTPKGLIVPVIKDCQSKSILEIAQELNQLQEAAMKGTILESQLQGGTFSLSNIGSIAGTYAVPVLVIPQTCIGAFGRLMTTPRYVSNNGLEASLEEIENNHAVVKPITVMNVSWSADHRVIDGATVARFSNTWKSYIESPDKLLMEMR